jgi:hypothetical protein
MGKRGDMSKEKRKSHKRGEKGLEFQRVMQGTEKK